MAKKSTSAEVDMRVNRVARMLSNGAVRSEIVQYCSKEWGVSERQGDKYIQKARDLLRVDWEIDRRTFTAELLSQLASLQKESRKNGQGHIALGCINSAAKLAQLIQ
jgi:hypothetical protein